MKDKNSRKPTKTYDFKCPYCRDGHQVRDLISHITKHKAEPHQQSGGCAACMVGGCGCQAHQEGGGIHRHPCPFCKNTVPVGTLIEHMKGHDEEVSRADCSTCKISNQKFLESSIRFDKLFESELEHVKPSAKFDKDFKNEIKDLKPLPQGSTFDELFPTYTTHQKGGLVTTDLQKHKHTPKPKHTHMHMMCPLCYEHESLRNMKEHLQKHHTDLIEVPLNVNKTATYSYKLKSFGFSSGEGTSFKLAKRLATQKYISIVDLRELKVWFDNNISSIYPVYRKWRAAARPKNSSYWHNKTQILAMTMLGGVATLHWINSSQILALLNKIYGEQYQKIVL